MAGTSGTNFASGFVGALAQGFGAKQERQRQAEQQSRQNSLTLAKFLIDSGQVGGVEDLKPLLGHAMPEIFGDKAKKAGKGGLDPAQTIGDILNKSLGSSQGQPMLPGPAANQSAAPTSPAAPVANPQPGGALDTGAPQAAPAALPSSPVSIPAVPPQRPSLAGVPLLTPQEVTARSIERTNATRAAEIQGQTDLARRILPQLQTIDKDFTIKDALDFVVNKQFQRTGVGSGAAFQAIPGEAPDENGEYKSIDAVFDKAKGQYLDPNTREPLVGFRKLSAARVGNERFFGKDLEAISREAKFGGKPYVEQSPEVKETINQEFAQRKQKEAGATATARTTATQAAMTEAQLNRPIGTSAGQQYNLPPTTPLKELVNTPGMTEAEKSKITSLSMADDSVKEINDLIMKVFPDVAGRSPLMARGLTALDLAQKNFARDGDYVKLNSEIGLAAINIARIAGETGRVPVQLVDKAQKALADLSLTGGDTRDSALAKMEIIKDLLKSARTNAPGGTGKPAAGGAPNAAPDAKLVNGQWVLP